MQATSINELTIKGQLKIQRDQLFGEFSKDPSNLHLAIEIRSIDDRIAALAEHLSSVTSGQLAAYRSLSVGKYEPHP